MIPYKPGDNHPTGFTRVKVYLSQEGLENEGDAMDFNWDILPEDDMGARIVGYEMLPDLPPIPERTEEEKEAARIYFEDLNKKYEALKNELGVE